MASPLDDMALEDTNMGGVGGPEDKAVRKKAAMGEPAWHKAGKQAGVQVWRVEKMEIKEWPKEKYGQFHTGDSYMVLETIMDTRLGPRGQRGQTRTEYNIFFWLGNETSVDEQCVAAYKTVELCEFFDGRPTQIREVQQEESARFRACFPKLTYLPGGIPSGLRHVITDVYDPHLFHIRKRKGGVTEVEVDCMRESLNEGDCFILDAGKLIYIFHGKFAHPLEKYACNVSASRMEAKRYGMSECVRELDSKFWNFLGGRGPIKAAEECTDEIATVDRGEGVLYKISDETGRLSMVEVGRKNLRPDMLDTNDVFMLDRVYEMFLWVGLGASKQENRSALGTAMGFMKTNERDAKTPIHMFREGHPISNKVWNKIFGGGMQESKPQRRPSGDAASQPPARPAPASASAALPGHARHRRRSDSDTW